jgi:hypothetical protein
MRWNTPQYGAVRWKHRFLWFPLTIGDETRWLEFAEWEELLLQDYCGDLEWVKDRWLD